MAELTAVVRSIDELAAYRISDELLLDFVCLSPTAEWRPESAAAGEMRVMGATELDQAPASWRISDRKPSSAVNVRKERGSSRWRLNQIPNHHLNNYETRF